MASTLLGEDAMCLVMFTSTPSMLNPCSLAAMPAIVIAHDAKDMQSKSVGEKDSPLPLLSVGASVKNSTPDFKCL